MERALNIEDTEEAMDDSIDEIDDVAIAEVEEEEQASSFSEESPPSQVPVESERVDEKTDPVSLYLRDIGSTPLLTREREVQLGIQMEQGQEEYIDSVVAIASRHLLPFGGCSISPRRSRETRRRWIAC